MQAPRMLPLLISVFAMPISLDMAILPGLSGMLPIAVVLFAMFSPVHAIIIAEAGVKAKAENIAAVIKIFIGNLAKNETSILPAFELRVGCLMRFREKIFFCAATQSEG